MDENTYWINKVKSQKLYIRGTENCSSDRKCFLLFLLLPKVGSFFS